MVQQLITFVIVAYTFLITEMSSNNCSCRVANIWAFYNEPFIICGKNIPRNYILKGLKLDSQSFSLGMGDNKTVSLSFTSQIGGPEQSGMGLFMSGYYPSYVGVPQ